jgi:hypothetical protein
LNVSAEGDLQTDLAVVGDLDARPDRWRAQKACERGEEQRLAVDQKRVRADARRDLTVATASIAVTRNNYHSVWDCRSQSPRG